MYTFKNNGGHVDLCVTPDHRMVYKLDFSEEVYTQPAKDISYSHKRFVCAGLKNGTVDELTDMDRLNIAYQADGTPVGGYKNSGVNRDGSRNGGFLCYSFTLTKERKISRLLDIVNRLGLWHTVSDKDEDGRIKVLVWVEKSHVLSKYFKDWVDLSNKSYKWCKSFIEEATNWDGYNTPGYDHSGYDSTVEENSDIVQAICTLAGYRAKKHTKEDKRSDTYKDLHRLSIPTGKDSLSRGTVKKDTIFYKGKVYCVSVPSGMLVVRRNGAVAISGNSLHNQTIVYICDSLNLDEKELYEAYTFRYVGST
jgi:hypothetical protein